MCDEARLCVLYSFVDRQAGRQAGKQVEREEGLILQYVDSRIDTGQ